MTVRSRRRKKRKEHWLRRFLLTAFAGGMIGFDEGILVIPSDFDKLVTLKSL